MTDAPDTAVLDPEPVVRTRTRPRSRRKPKRQPRYNVVLWNDETHTYAYVIQMLMVLFGHPPERAYQMAREVDTTGRVIVLTTTLEHAELKRDQIRAYGKDDLVRDCPGSMYSTVEPCE